MGSCLELAFFKLKNYKLTADLEFLLLDLYPEFLTEAKEILMFSNTEVFFKTLTIKKIYIVSSDGGNFPSPAHKHMFIRNR